MKTFHAAPLNPRVFAGTVRKFGYNADVDAGTEDIWIGGGSLNWPSAAAATNIISSSTDDDASPATGANTVTVEGLDANYQLVRETAEMNGQTQVALTTQFLRVFRAWVATAGTGLTNAGNIDVRHTTTILARIGTGDGQTLQAGYTVPKLNIAGKAITGALLLGYFGSYL